MIQQMKSEYAVKQLCDALACPVSTVYYEPKAGDESELVAAIERVLMRFPFYGCRKVQKELTRQGLLVGEHVVRRLLRELGVSRSVGKLRVQTTDSNHPRYPNRIKGLDAYTRAVRGWALSRHVDQQLTLAALDMALEQAVPFIFHSDQGSQYAAWEHTERLLNLHVKISMSDKASPTQNGLVEHFIRTVKEEHIDYTDYDGFDDAFRQLKHWLEVVYMTERIHQALDYVTPAEFEAAALVNVRYPLLSPA